MAVPAQLLERIPAVRQGEFGASGTPVPSLPLGMVELDSVLPDGGLPRGAVTELAVLGGSAHATSLSLLACRSAQAALGVGGDVPWCAFVDPSSTLHGPGVAGVGVELSRLLIVRPALEALERTAIRLAESHAFSVVVVDTLGAPGVSVGAGIGAWPRVVRRLSLAAEESKTCVLLLTDGEAHRPLPLPVALRLELEGHGGERLSIRVAKERRGRISAPRTIVWGKPRAKVVAGVRHSVSA